MTPSFSVRIDSVPFTSRRLAIPALLAFAAAAAAQAPAAGSSPPSVAEQAAHAANQGPASGLHSIKVSLDVMAAAGTSTERNAVLDVLQGGGHDPKQRGFTLQQAELGLAGAIDDYIAGEAMIMTQLQPDTGETLVELEEAYLVTTRLPNDLTIKAGHYLTEFGRLNPVHAHSWLWLDQPIVSTRIMGGDGMRAPGARIAWDLVGENPAEVIFGIQNASGETVPSFLGNAEQSLGGRTQEESRDVRSFGDSLFAARFDTDRKLGEHSTLGLGVSAAFGPNATGDGGDTVLYGVDFALKDKHDDGSGFMLQGEFIARSAKVGDQVDENTDDGGVDDVAIPGDTLEDRGAYLQGYYQCANGWGGGLRLDWVTGKGDSYDRDTDTFSRDADPTRSDRFRISPLIGCELNKMTRVRLQYNYDDSDSFEDPVHSVWLGFVMMLGQHGPHVYRAGR